MGETQEIAVEGTTPGRFDTGQVDSDTLVLGAPYIGKSELARETADHTAASLVDADEGDLATETDTLVVDEFYTVYQAAGADEREAFEARLAIETTTVCVFARPRAFDWLLNAEDVPLSEAVLEAFDRVVHLRYDPDDDREGALALAKQLGVDEHGDGDGLDEAKLIENLEDLSYRYEYRNERLSSSLGTYGETLVPTLVAYISIQAGKEGLLSDGVVAACRDLAANFSITEFVGSTKDLATEVVKPESIGVVGASVGGPAFAAAVSLGMWLYVRQGSITGDDAPEPELAESLGVLAGDDLTPTARAELEYRLDLPPRTLDHLSTLLEGESLRRLRELCENAPERMDEFEERVDTHEAELAEVRSTVDRLEDEVGSLEAFYSEQLAGAAFELDEIAAEIRSAEQTYSGLDINVEDIPLMGTTNKGDPLEKTVLNAFDNDAPIVVLRGSHATGKTTTAVKVGRRLENRGYRVRIPNLNQEGSLTLLRERLDGGDQPVALFASFKLNVGEVPGLNEGNLENLFRLIQDGTCSVLLLECRDELYNRLTNAAKAAISGQQLGYPWDQRFEIKLERIDDDEIEKVVRWLVKKHPQGDDYKSILSEVQDVAKGNPGIAKIASRLAINGEDITGFSTWEELVLYDIQHILSDETPREKTQREVFESLAITNELTGRQLVKVLNIKPGELQDCQEALKGYLNHQLQERAAFGDSERWTISPAVYREAVFWKVAVEPTEARLNNYIMNLRPLEMDEFASALERIATNLAVVFQEQESEERREQVVDRCIYDVLEVLADYEGMERAYYRSVQTLVDGSVTLPIDNIDINYAFSGRIGQVGARREEFQWYHESYKQSPGAFTTTTSYWIFLPHLAGNHALAGNDSVAQEILMNIPDELLEFVKEHDPETFEETYNNTIALYNSHFVAHLATQRNPGNIEYWIEQAEKSVQEQYLAQDTGRTSRLAQISNTGPEEEVVYLLYFYYMTCLIILEQMTEEPVVSEGKEEADIVVWFNYFHSKSMTYVYVNDDYLAFIIHYLGSLMGGLAFKYLDSIIYEHQTNQATKLGQAICESVSSLEENFEDQGVFEYYTKMAWSGLFKCQKTCFHMSAVSNMPYESNPFDFDLNKLFDIWNGMMNDCLGVRRESLRAWVSFYLTCATYPARYWNLNEIEDFVDMVDQHFREFMQTKDVRASLRRSFQEKGSKGSIARLKRAIGPSQSYQDYLRSIYIERYGMALILVQWVFDVEDQAEWEDKIIEQAQACAREQGYSASFVSEVKSYFDDEADENAQRMVRNLFPMEEDLWIS